MEREEMAHNLGSAGDERKGKTYSSVEGSELSLETVHTCCCIAVRYPHCSMVLGWFLVGCTGGNEKLTYTARGKRSSTTPLSHMTMPSCHMTTSAQSTYIHV